MCEQWGFYVCVVYISVCFCVKVCGCVHGGETLEVISVINGATLRLLLIGKEDKAALGVEMKDCS